MDDSLRGLRALVTGSASGIGAATAARLRAHGAQVIGLDVRPSGPAPGGMSEFGSMGDAAASGPAGDDIVADLRDAEAVTAAVAAAAATLGGLDAVLNIAGVSAVGDVAANPDEEWARVLDVNVVAIARVSRAALPHLRRSDRASIVNVASIAATAGLPQRALYSASKGAVLALTRAMAADHCGENIRVNAVSPGTVATPWIDRLLSGAADPERGLAQLVARQPMGRLATADEVADAICYLVSPAASFLTGTAIEVDGGMAGLRLPPRH
ncbi:SDR family NAD(P)-dependent oxidoreductase [Micromonospora eburnea]|uniref:NAD(P)-dependent dehydrogenase, short-chain alcohol dehydrogenase family n=1 Tax=Micromonospora eburnea TaxID=227316 RepID=A0A1C6UIF0_9ACTN|nr:SDR family oxidoreductase [Micromonospora eburnea]SCL53772.1 NAD(P)-dependent dehydrogenase, short-chain alcohol dehydrogenase family [Micromonospora eburnea]